MAIAEAAESLDGSVLGLELRPGEELRAVFHPDLDADLAYGPGLVALTTERVSYRMGERAFGSVELGDGVELGHREHAGLGELTLSDGAGLSLRFFHTLARAREVTLFLDAYAALRSGPGALVHARHEQDEDELDSPPSSSRRPLLRLVTFARPHVGTVLIGLILTLATTAAGLIPPYLTMPLVDNVLVPGQGGALALRPALLDVSFYLGALGLAAVVTWLLAWAQGAVLASVTERISADLRNRTFAHLQRLSLEYFGGKRTGDLIARISTDTDHLCSFLSDSLIDFITDMLMIVGTAAVLFALDPLLAAAALVSFPPIAWLIMRVRGRLTHGFLRGGRVWSAMTNILADTIPGIRVVKAFSQEQREISRFERANERIVQVNSLNNRLWTFFWPLVALLNQLGLLVVWAVGAWQVLHQRITIGVLTAFIAYIGRFYTRVESMSRILTATQKAAAGAQRLFEILDRVPSVIEPKEPVALEQLRGAIRFDRVSFRYGSRLILNDVSFDIAPGQMVGIVGHTGSGKSTVANLLCRFYDVSSGAVLVDDIDIRKLAITPFRRHIGIVLQDPFLFFGTIAENVAYGMPLADGALILRAARAARAHEFVLKLPEAYDSLVGERGQSLSGGERQRIAIARAILVDPRILILDEATSAVDVQTEREIQRALDNVVRGRTTVAIAHRLSTLRRADFLVVLRDGRVVESGTHGELMARDGDYARLQRAQAEAAPSEAEVEGAPDSAASGELELSPLIEPRALSLELGGDRALRLRAPSLSEPVVVTPRRAFPLTHAAGFVCLIDARGRELACVERLSELDSASAKALERALSRSEFLPLIERIERVIQDSTRSEWHVITDRGERRFVIEQEDHIRRLEDGRHLITDADGMRYLVPASEAMDVKSRRWLSRFAS